MAPSSLLRYIFRRGPSPPDRPSLSPQSPKRNPPHSNPAKGHALSSPRSSSRSLLPVRKSVLLNDIAEESDYETESESESAPQTPDNSRSAYGRKSPHIFEDQSSVSSTLYSISSSPPTATFTTGLIKNDENGHVETVRGITNRSPENTDAHLITTALSNMNLDISTCTTRTLLHATIDEAKTALHAHLDTLQTTLALLDALDGFSATIPVLKAEMLASQKASREKLDGMHSLDTAIQNVEFDNEMEESGGREEEEDEDLGMREYSNAI